MRGFFTEAGALLLTFFATIVGVLFRNEALGLLSKLSRFLVDCAVRQLPEAMREEKREEWPATLEYEGQDGKRLSELWAALEAWRSAGATAKASRPELDPETQAEIERTLDRMLYRGPAVALNELAPLARPRVHRMNSSSLASVTSRRRTVRRLDVHTREAAVPIRSEQG